MMGVTSEARACANRSGLGTTRQPWEYQVEPPYPTEPSKFCLGDCGQVRPLTDFGPGGVKGHKDGRNSWCRACAAKRAQRYRAADPEAYRAANRRYRTANLEARRDASRRFRAANTALAFDYYGRMCACCGSTERLSIDHVNGDRAAKGRKRRGAEFYRWLITQGFPDGYQTMCGSCNASKGTGDRCHLTH